MKIIFLALALTIGFQISAQVMPEYYDESLDENLILSQGYASIGFGLGLNYGGVGMNIGYNVADKVNLFTGIGYNLHKVGVNVGVAYDFLKISRSNLYISAMGGYNAVSVIEGAPEYTDTFYGLSTGFGIKVESKYASNNYWQFGVILPFRNQRYNTMLSEIKNDPRIAEFNEPWPILISIGYNGGF